MSRVAKKPIAVPKDVEINIESASISAKGKKGSLSFALHEAVRIEYKDNVLHVQPQSDDQKVIALAGTTRALVANMITGVSEGFQRKLVLVGVGYRAQLQGKVLNLQLGFSHPVSYEAPEGIVFETPTQTEIIIRGADKGQVGQVAADIRAIRPPEPYKGKGVRYDDERIILKETKKK
jgi:large subunit ribosomal protein L6